LDGSIQGCGQVRSATTIDAVRPRFHLSRIDASGRGELDADETAHLRRVLRLGAGDAIDVFDGRGGMFHARVIEVGRAATRIEVMGPAPHAPEAAVAVTLAMSVLKGDKMDEVVRDAVMMGVAAIEPVVAARSELSLAALGRGHRAERWQRVAVAAVKQCGRATVPPVRPPAELGRWVGESSDTPTLVLQEPSAGAAGTLRRLTPSRSVRVLVGPEGGWTEEERARFGAAGFAGVSLGGRTLRAEAAPLVALAAIYEAWDGW
jgi:16S rRNA (uracil1498-N3)-methyltransferase